MEGTGRSRLLQTLAGLGKDELRRWKEKLSKIPLKEGYQRIPQALLETADPGALAELLISYYGEEDGLQLALVWDSRQQGMRALPTEQQRKAIVPGTVKSPTEIRAPLVPGITHKEHFIDQHREQLIQRVRQVDGVLDKLYSTVLDNEQYQSIRAERTDPEKMRKLFDLLPSWNRDCKDQLYQVLEAKQKFLIQELKGT
uniref:Apoptosis-associated speck-like protein containing a CARD n=1 Tax=Chelydra serpentina TaxID=8475 RepID=A0A8C3T486_CHESE